MTDFDQFTQFCQHTNLWKNSIFWCRFEVKANGRVEKRNEAPILGHLLLCQMYKHLTISSTNKQRASIDLIFVLCSPTELTNTSVGPTQYFIPFGPTQSNKYQHFRQFFLNYTKLPISASVLLQMKKHKGLTKNVLETYWAPNKQCHLWSVPWHRLVAGARGSKGEQGEGLGKFTFCQVPTTRGPCDMVAVLMRGAGGYLSNLKIWTMKKNQSDHVASGFFSSNWQALLCEDHLLRLKMCNDGYWARHPISLLGFGAWGWAGAWGLSGWVMLLPTSRESACRLPCHSHC